jgi:Transposase IS66 family
MAGRQRLSAQTLAELDASYRELIALGYEENPGLMAAPAGGRRPKRTRSQNLRLRLDEREDEVLRFANDFRVPFDNNLSERDGRGAVPARRRTTAAPRHRARLIDQSGPPAILPRVSKRSRRRQHHRPSVALPAATPAGAPPLRATEPERLLLDQIAAGRA